jgi:hypothetical protein
MLRVLTLVRKLARHCFNNYKASNLKPLIATHNLLLHLTVVHFEKGFYQSLAPLVRHLVACRLHLFQNFKPAELLKEPRLFRIILEQLVKDFECKPLNFFILSFASKHKDECRSQLVYALFWLDDELLESFRVRSFKHKINRH